MNRGNPTRSLRAAGWLLGLAMGGFFDGILLHQVLQWHHLLSNVRAAALQDAGAQVLADGLFHLLMYVVAGVGLWFLWRARAAFAQPRAGRLLWGLALAGFGAWHLVDAVFSHWITGIHRIRIDSPDPLFWDLLWAAVFGLVPLLLGLWLQRGGGGAAGGRAAAVLALAAVVAGTLAARPAPPTGEQMVWFRPGTPPAATFDALGRVDARVLWTSGTLWAVRLPDDASAARQLRRAGALLVGDSPVALGCLSWLRVATAPAGPGSR